MKTNIEELAMLIEELESELEKYKKLIYQMAKNQEKSALVLLELAEKEIQNSTRIERLERLIAPKGYTMTRTALFVLCALFVVLGSEAAKSDIVIQSEVFAFNDIKTEPDFKGYSPLASIAIKYEHQVSDRFIVYIGLKHESSIPYKEIGGGFDGFIIGSELKIF